ncbi:F420-dependent oxidoreductase, MSMEG_4879 family [Thermomonospora echinospora]|uniref:F420-dependent oxidoreductase, MSMEG_4879 family n=1 Tax=Thermomonospora echinospora TaxID=1992 RepID=A0A1H6E5A0_9ACTN|nr:LLM class flavin-dependent oxidoreductase [Thermomonospora echinospora]SEG92938.1 F420-dependent oxidoreductase, MSMEG_4879 family [Thermomonospora echinospora]
MRIAVHSGVTMRGRVEGVVGEVRKVAEYGLAGYWAPMLTGHDTLTTFAIAGREVPGVELGTAVVPMPLRPPFALAQQVATVQEVLGGRLALGIGPSHEALVRDAFGLEWTPPIAATRRYVEQLQAVMTGRDGRGVAIGGDPTPILLGAVNPAMARLAAQVAAGVVTWAAGPRTITEVIRPALRDRPAEEPFRIVAALPVCVTDDVASAREHIHRRLGANDRFPSYQKVLRREGVDGVARLAIVGSPDEVARRLDAFADSGVTDFAAHPLAENDVDAERTWEFLAARAAAR